MKTHAFVPKALKQGGLKGSPWKLAEISDKHSIPLDDADASVGDHPFDKDTLRDAIGTQTDRIGELQKVLYADASRALLVILQGRDASGKDGTIRKVFSAVNPLGCEVTSFKVPSAVESSHDFLWRVHNRAPARGMIGIFNRSQYEDIIVPRVHKSLPKSVWSARYDQINAFERHLSANGTVILKFMLHVSREEQKARLQERLTDETKNWKFRAGDLQDREKWNEFTKAYRGVIENTSTEAAPWYLVPADDNRMRDFLVASAIADALDRLELRYSKAESSVLAQTIL